MDHASILEKILDVYSECHIKAFPFDCVSILNSYQVKVYTYSEIKLQNERLYQMCTSYSGDAFKYGDKVAYNEEMPLRRIRFTLMHELGHKILQHMAEDEQQEMEANFFASNILAPRMAIHYAHCKNAADTARLFCLSEEAAWHAFDDYRRWHRRAAYKMSPTDKRMYTQFYDSALDGFAFEQHRCAYCGSSIFNRPGIAACASCCSRMYAYQLKYHAYSDPLSAETRAIQSF